MLDGKRTVRARAPMKIVPLFLRGGAVVPLLPRTVNTLSEYGDDVEGVADNADRRTLIAAPVTGRSAGTLGPGETLSSQVTSAAWTLRLDASTARTYDVQATLSGLGRDWRPCGIFADGQEVPFTFRAGQRVLLFSAATAAAGVVRVTACR